MLSLIRGGEKAASHNLGLQSEQKKERIWGQEVTVLPPRRSHVKATVEILLCGEREYLSEERGERQSLPLYMCIIHTLSSSLH